LMDWNMAAADPCSWNLITCSPDNFNFSGTLLAPSIGNLTYLETVLLQNNYITGNIPPEIGKLMKLKTLDLSNNIFSGQLHLLFLIPKIFRTIPTSVANMTQLILLDLSYSNLSGAAPTLHANTFNVMGNPQICSTGNEEECNETHPKTKSLIFSSSDPSDGGTINQKFTVQFGLSLACICLLIIH
ncbi:hypothetical protein BRARA_B03180, partial [Brassica rapa]